MTPRVKGFTMGSIAAASYGLNPLFALPLYREGMGVDSVLFYRYAFAIVMMAIMLRVQRVDMRVRRREWPLLAIYGLLFSASSLFLFLSYNYMDAGIASTILFMYPVMVALIMALCFGERASLLTWVCIGLAISGVSLLTKTSDGTTVSTLGITFVLLSSLSYAIYIVGVNRSSIARMPSAKLTFYALCFGILIYITRTRALTDLQLPQSMLGWACAFCLALFPTIISLVTMTISIRNIGSTSAAILGALEPITALLVGTLVFGERLTPRLCVGIVLVLLAVTLLVAGKKIYYTVRNLLKPVAIVLLVWMPMDLVAAEKACPEVKLHVERLPDLHVPRAGHASFYVNGEPTVVGGHTTGFIPTATLEYYRDGAWHLLETTYPHDQALCHLLHSGQLLLGGGHNEHLGIGHIFAFECYDPATHTLDGYGCLDKKRCMAEALELDSGRVLISGNWYHADGMELYDGTPVCKPLGEVSQQRACPYIFRTAQDNAIIFSAVDSYDHPFDSIIVDRMRGEPFTPPLFNVWRPLICKDQHHAWECFIGDEAVGRYAYLMPVEDADGQLAVALVEGEGFSLLPTQHPVPMQGRGGQRITYFTTVVTDRDAGRGYVVGHDTEARLYVLAVDYARASEPGGAPVTLYYTDPQDSIGYCMPVLTPEGNLLMAGGMTNSNYTPFASALILHLSGQDRDAVSNGNWRWRILWGILLSMVLILVACWFFIRSRRSSQASPVSLSQDGAVMSDALMLRICALMEERQLFRQSGLKLSDVAVALNSNNRYVADCIKQHHDCSFLRFVNAYRVEYAKALLHDHPDMKLSVVAEEAGFSNETSFFRTFKSFTGSTPREWIASID